MKFLRNLCWISLVWISGVCPIFGQEFGLTWPASQRLIVDQPAMVGRGGQSELYLGAYQKWFGLDQAPSTFYLGGGIPLAGRRIGMGGFLLRDQVGLLTQTRLSLFAAAHSPTDRAHQVSVGVSASVQRFQVEQPNVIDLIGPQGYQSNRANFGVALNYRLRYDKKGSWLNLQLQVPQLFREVTLNDNSDSASLLLDMPSQYVFQANLRQQLGQETYLLPSVRVYTYQSKQAELISLLDLGVGISFKEDLFQVRMGYRNAQASQLYAGIGIKLGRTIDAAILIEPVGALGVSGGADLKFAFGEPDTTPKPDLNANKWKEPTYWESRLENAGLRGYFKVSSLQDKDFVYVTYLFDDTDDLLYDLTEDRFLKVEDLLEELQAAVADVEKKEGKIARLDLIAEIKSDFDEVLEAPFSSDQPLTLTSHFQEGLPQPSVQLLPGDTLTAAQVAAVKLQYLQKKVEQGVSAIPQSVLAEANRKVERNPTLEYNRRISIRLIFDK